MAQISFEVPTNADAVWWMELGKKLGQKMEVVFDCGDNADRGNNGDSFHKKSYAHSLDIEIIPDPEIFRYVKSIKRKNPKVRK